MIDIITAVFLVCGLVFFAGGAVGIIRFPDFYSRLHPAGKLDSAGHFMMMSGMAIYTAQELTFHSMLAAVKIFLIVLFVYITSPTATHAILDAGVRGGLEHWSKE